MVTEKDLIAKIRKLSQIKPGKNWVALTKKELFREEPKKSFFPLFFPVFRTWKPVFATITTLGILLGLFLVSQNSLPGDFLYPIKKVGEKSQTIFVSEKEKPKAQLELVNKRLEDLTKIAQANRIKNLAPAINEFQANIQEAAKSLTASSSDPEIIKGIVEETQKLKENKEKVEALGIVIGETEEFDNALAKLVAREIKNLESRTLTEKQQELLAEAKDAYSAGDYNLALEKILLLSYSQE